MNYLDVVNKKYNIDEVAYKISLGGLSYEEYTQYISAFVFEKDYESAEFAIDRAIYEHKSNFRLQLLYGDLCISQGKITEGIEKWDKLKTKSPEEVEIIVARKCFAYLIAMNIEMANSL
jgi:lipopolysaccharide biosynthesis regulator YciM